NVMTSSPVVRSFTGQKSNIELINGLKSNFAAAKAFTERKREEQEPKKNSKTHQQRSLDYKQWTSLSPDGSTLYMPCQDFVSAASGLAEERVQYDITVKLFFLPGASTEQRCCQVTEAVSLVCEELGVDSIDLLIASWPGVTFDGGEEGPADSEDELFGDGVLISRTSTTSSPDQSRRRSCCQDARSAPATFESMLTTWRVLESLVESDTIRQLGLAEFDTARLSAFLSHVRVAPVVDQIYVRDCCI
ncbi:hypothetical protein KEM55_006478, partial [Ascosphaera atra]